MKKTKRLKLMLMRKKRGITQEKLAEKTSYSPAQISSIESGDRDGTLEFWQTVQDALDIPDSDMWTLMKKE